MYFGYFQNRLTYMYLKKTVGYRLTLIQSSTFIAH